MDLAIKSVAADGETPSPMPTRILDNTSPGMNPATAGIIAVAKDHTTTPTSSTFLQSA
uniref:Uncharacterized protein n=1 Tax=Arundo donax TaxID=35708 RepID=A0A0A9DN52_ARUDO